MSLIGCFPQVKDDISLSEGSTVDLRKPGEEEDEYSEMAEETMDPDNCFPEGKLIRPLFNQVSPP